MGTLATLRRPARPSSTNPTGPTQRAPIVFVHKARGPLLWQRQEKVLGEPNNTMETGAMTETAFTVRVEHVQGYQFRALFDWPDVQALVLDEPEPVGSQAGPNAARLVAVAVANCLSASLLFCLRKARVELQGLQAEVTVAMSRNESGRLRLGQMEVSIRMAGTPAEAEASRMLRCAGLFEQFCTVTESIRQGIPIAVTVQDERGIVLHHSPSTP